MNKPTRRLVSEVARNKVPSESDPKSKDKQHP
jgi:hypothetical protein